MSVIDRKSKLCIIFALILFAQITIVIMNFSGRTKSKSLI